jgi:hypothetical protein
MVKAPLDTTGENGNLPPPLRTVYFCPLHFRNWIPSCLKTMTMAQVLSHIVYGARPCYGAMDGLDDEGAKKKAPRRRRTKRRLA